ncbi:uncharacterized protein LOC135213422 [Macrobrachium nipponense]|uniref:uncharacterized protein LOC135213422 n=1 Tax=Macrobrachium nipponense TaxID=159736 RepID=UPI0030C82703
MERADSWGEEAPLPHQPIPAPPMFSGDSPGLPDTTSEESLYGGMLEYLRRGDQEDEGTVGGVPRSQSYTEGIVQQPQEPQMMHAHSHNALLEESPTPEKKEGESKHSCLHTLHTVVACQQEQIAVLQATLRDLAVTYTHREKALLRKLHQLQHDTDQQPAGSSQQEQKTTSGDDSAEKVSKSNTVQSQNFSFQMNVGIYMGLRLRHVYLIFFDDL